MQLRLLRQHCEYIIATFVDFHVGLIATTMRNPLTIYLRLDTITAIDKYRFVITIFLSFCFYTSIFFYIVYTSRIAEVAIQFRFNVYHHSKGFRHFLTFDKMYWNLLTIAKYDWKWVRECGRVNFSFLIITLNYLTCIFCP